MNNEANNQDSPYSFEKNFEINWSEKIEKIYEIPDVEDMAAVVIRGNFKNERQANAILRLSRRHKKFNLDEHQEMLRQKIASTAAIGGVRSLEALFAATGLVASDMYRVTRGLPKLKKGEEERVYRGSDFRSQEKPSDNSERQN